MTTFSDQVFQLGGVPVNSPFILQTGKSIFVKPITGSNNNPGNTPALAVKTLAQALSLARADKNDVVYLIAESNTASLTTDYQSATLDWNKDGVHLIGVNNMSIIGQRSRIAQLSSVLTIDSLVKISADNCLIANLEIFQGVASQTAVSPVALEVTGQRNHIVNCQISGIGNASNDVAAARSLVINGGAENLFSNCYIGLDTISRATAAAEIELKASATRNFFEDCYINSMAGAAGFLHVKANAAAAAIDRFVSFKNCIFMNAVNSTATTMDASIAVHASLGGTVLIVGGGVMGCTRVAAADTALIKLLSMDATTSTTNGLIQSLNVA